MLRSAPPVTLCPPVLPSREHKQTFFPTHLLYSYNHRSYQWSHPHGCKQACIDEPLLAQSCRTILLWAYHYAYSKEAMPPKFLYKYTFTGIEPADLALYRAMLYPLYQRVRRFYVYVYKNYTKWCLHLDSNQEPTDYESGALTNWAIEAIWCDWPDSNRHAITARDFKSLVATNYTTVAKTFSTNFLKNKLYYISKTIYCQMNL